MRGLRSLRPFAAYAVVAATVVVASVAALAASVGTRPLGDPDAGLTPPSAEPTGVTARLAATDRLAFWRVATDLTRELWVSDLDGGRRRVLASEPRRSAVSLTRWSPDGDAVAYVVGDDRVKIASGNGATATLVLPATLATSAWKVVAVSWSPGSDRLAVTVRSGGGVGNERDLFVVEARAGAAWRRLGVPTDAVGGPWLDHDHLLVETASAMIAVADLTNGSLRPLTAMPAVSPLLGPDGRIHFVGGQGASEIVPTLPQAIGRVWSATADGRDVRADPAARMPFTPPMRLAAVLADGRAVVTAQGSGAFLVGESVAQIASPSDAILRASVASDGRRVVAFTPSRILLADPARTQPATAGPAADVVPSTILVGDVLDADAWASGSPFTPAAAPEVSGGAPGARFAFEVGGVLWTWSPPAPPVAIASGLSGPVWSARGDRIAATAFREVRSLPVALRADGTGRVDLDMSGAAFVWYGPGGMSWTSDGALAVQLALADRALAYATRLYDPVTGAVRATLAGRATWAGDRLVVLTDGVLDDDTGNRVEQQVLVRDGAGERVLTDARRLADDPLLLDLPDRALQPTIADVVPTGDPGLLGVYLQRTRFGGYASAALVVVGLSDGRARWRSPFTPLTTPRDVAFAPTGTLVGWTVRRADDRGALTDGTASVVDIAADAVVRTVPGRFAGWSPDGASFYVARAEGLFAYRVSGGDPTYLGPYGAPVVAAPGP